MAKGVKRALMVAKGVLAPIRAYHGTPYDFDRFDFNKIGAGEGAQAYGHGLYFAGHEPVAKGYRDKLAKDWFVTPSGKFWTPDSLEHLNVRVRARDHAPYLDRAIEQARDILSGGHSSGEMQAKAKRDLDKLIELQKQGGVSPVTGRMYEVAIHADPEKFLDWDRPLRDQRHILEMAAESVGGERAARQAWKDWEALNDHLSGIDYDEGHPLWKRYNQLSALGPDRARIRLGRLYDALDKEAAAPEKYPANRQLTQKGEDLYFAISQMGKTNALGSQALETRGVPGVKYFDALSRGAGEGTSNYVVFPTPEDILEITRKYARGGAITKDERRALMIARDQQALQRRDDDVKRALMTAKHPLTQDVYHGTQAVFDRFKKQDSTTASLMLGTHVARDPKIASNSYFTDRTGEKGGHVLPLKTYPDDKFYRIEQNFGHGLLEDDDAVSKNIQLHAFRKDPEKLVRVLQTHGVDYPEAVEGAKALLASKSWTSPRRQSTYGSLLDFVERGQLPGADFASHEDRKAAVKDFRDHLIKQGYAGVRYINTAPDETAGAKDKANYIVFNKPTSEGYYPLRGRFAKFDPAEKASPDLMKADGGPIDAYHGSPHDFDKFDFSKIGTGEGAQAYGHGMYLADSPEVALSYKQEQSPQTPEEVGVEAAKSYYESRRKGSMRPIRIGGKMKLVKQPPMSHEEALKEIYADLTSDAEKAHIHRHTLKALDDFVNTGEWPKRKSGHLYDVRFHADPESLLDIDKPLADQSPKVRKALALRPTNTGIGGGPKLYSESTGMYIPDKPDVARAVIPTHDKGAVAAMEKAGIPGLRYFDALSRGAGAGTRNYVVFPTDKEILEITRKRADGGEVKPFPRSKDPEAHVNAGYARHTEDVPVEWLSRMPGNERRLKDADYAELKHQLQTEGIREPLTILVGQHSGTAMLGEGNHRLMIARELGYTHVPARVYMGRKWGSQFGWQGDYSHDLIPEPDKYFPSDAKPSDVFKSLQARKARAHGGRTKDARRALMIARDHQALLRRVANIYQGPRGGLDPSPGGGGYAGPGGGKYIGPSNYADGGGVDNPKGEWSTVDLAPTPYSEGVPHAVVKNPTPDDIHRIMDMTGDASVRWLRDKRTKDVHAFTGMVLHDRMRGALNIPAEESGTIYRDKGKLVSGGSHNLRDVLRYADGGKIPPFKLHSGAAKLIAQKGQAKGTPQQYAAMPGIKPDELKHSKFDELGSEPVDRAKVHGHLIRNQIPLRETVLKGDDPKSALGRYGEQEELVIPGGENHREVLLHLPLTPNTAFEKALHDRNVAKMLAEDEERRWEFLKGRHGLEDPKTVAQEDKMMMAQERLGDAQSHLDHVQEQHSPDFRDGHYDTPNVLAHIRMSDRRGLNGEKILHVEEMQSDWAQKGRKKGFRTGAAPLTPAEEEEMNRLADRGSDHDEASYARMQELAKRNFIARQEEGRLPSGPYVDNTSKWTDLALKRVLHEAAHGNYDKVVFTPGEAQNERYGLTNRVHSIHYSPDTNDLYYHDKDNDNHYVRENITPDKLPEYIGAELTDRLLKQQPVFNSAISNRLVFELKGNDLKIGGKGMKGYYDEIMPKRLQALAKQHDPSAKVQLYKHRLLPRKVLEGRDIDPADVMEHMGVPPHEWSTRWPSMSEADKSNALTSFEQSGPALHSIDVTPQMRDSIKQNGFNQFKRGGDVGMRQRYADGGGADNPVVNKALDLVSMFQPAKPTMAQRVVPQGGEPTAPGSVSIKSLSEAFDRAIQHHTSLGPEDRAANSRAALQKIAPYLGKSKTGVPSPLLTKNAKLMKSEAGYKGGDPISLPNGQGVETTGLALAPAYQEGKFTTCPNSASCKKECLGKFAGGYFYAGGGQDPDALKGPRLNSVRKTQAMLREPEAFAVRLHDEIEAAKRMADMNNNMLGVRLNVLSDINPRVHKAIIDAHPDVAFYDYTKNNTNPVAPNHHYTYSSTGVSDTDVDNPHSNWKQMRKRLDTGSNVAMAFSHKAHLPETVFDEETGKRYRVVNGDSHDFRPLDIQPRGQPGVIVGLRNKKISSTNEAAHRTSNGFFVKYNPDFLVGNKGKRVKDMHGNPIAQNTEVRIRHQKQAPTLKSNDEAETP